MAMKVQYAIRKTLCHLFFIFEGKGKNFLQHLQVFILKKYSPKFGLSIAIALVKDLGDWLQQAEYYPSVI
jgi:hypothetical protein